MSTTDDDKIRAAEKRQREYSRMQNAHRRRYKLGRRAEARERDFWETVNFSSLKGRSFSLEPDDTADQTTFSPTADREVKSETEPPSASAQSPIWVDSGSDEDEESEVHASLHTDESEHDHKTRRDFQEYDELPDSEEERIARLEASRRKMEEINAQDGDRMEARRRIQEAQRRKEEEERRRRQEEARRRRQQEEEVERARRAREEAQRRERRRSSWADQNQHRRTDDGTGFHRPGTFWGDNANPRPGGINFEWFDPNQWSTSQRRAASSSTGAASGWTSAKALQRYNTLSESFDNFKGTPDRPVPALDQIPWPVLLPRGFTINDIDWATVEKFFTEAETLMGGRGRGRKEWKEFLKTSTRRFHPDRWRARGLIGDKGWGADVEEKVNHVAKVLTPLYRSLDQ